MRPIEQNSPWAVFIRIHLNVGFCPVQTPDATMLRDRGNGRAIIAA